MLVFFVVVVCVCVCVSYYYLSSSSLSLSLSLTPMAMYYTDFRASFLHLLDSFEPRRGHVYEYQVYTYIRRTHSKT